MTSGQEKALKQVLLNYANDEDTGSYEVIQAIAAILGCDGEVKPRWVWLTRTGRPVGVDKNEVVSVTCKYDTPESWETIISLRGGNVIFAVDGALADVCAKLGIPVEGQ